MAFTTADNNFGVAKWIVDATAGHGTHTTIASALTSASSGDTIFIRPGTYTENITAKAGVDLVAFDGDQTTPNVAIVGTVTMTAAGTASLSGIRITTNAATAVSVTGSNAVVLHLRNCFLNLTNSTGITCSNTSASISLEDCDGDLGATGKYFAISGGTLLVKGGVFNNTGASSTGSTFSAGASNFYYTTINDAFTTSSTASINAYYVNIARDATTVLTLAGTFLGVWDHCNLASGNATTITVGSGCELGLFNATVTCTSGTPITGAGTLKFTPISFTANSGVTVTTQTNDPFNPVQSFTPAIAFGGGTTGITYSAQTGSYQVLGNSVYFTMHILLSNKGSSTGDMTFTGVALATGAAGGQLAVPMGRVQNMTSVTGACFMLGNNSSTTWNLYQNASSGAATTIKDTNVNNNTEFNVTGNYLIV